MKKGLHKETVLTILAIALPAVMAGAIALFYAIQTGSGMPMPQWNDEAVYYAQVKMWIEHGASAGYWGFNGGHALVGTGGAWNPAILLPYVIVGKVFGWGYSSVALWNVVFLCIANTIVLKIVNGKVIGAAEGAGVSFAGYLMLIELGSLHLWLYLNTIMSEPLRFAYAIILAALLYRGLFRAQKPTGRWAIGTGLYLLFLLQVYIFFAFAIPLYVFALLRGKKTWVKLVGALICTVVVAGGSYVLLHLISSNYNIFKTENLLSALQAGQIGTAIMAFLQMAKAGIGDLWYCMLGSTGHGLFHWYVVYLAILAIAPLIIVYLLWKKGARSICGALCVVSYSVLLFTGMYITVYSLEAFTFFRGTGIVVLFSLMMLAMAAAEAKGSREETLNGSGKAEAAWRAMFIAYAIGLFYLPANMADFHAERYVTEDERAEWDALGERLTQTIQLSEESDVTEENRWKNTAVLYTLEPKLIAALPAGIGQNYMMYSDEIITDAEYLIFSMKDKDAIRADWLEQSYFSVYASHWSEIDGNYFIQYTDENYIIYKKKAE